jgi:SAM-dependent methyltransferase
MTADLSSKYDVAFYSSQLIGAEAKEIALLTRILYERFHKEPVEKYGAGGPVVRESQVTSVLDVGCGMGAFLVAFQRLGVPKVEGIEHPHLYRTVGTSALPKEVSYSFLDLAEPIPGIYIGLWDRFDLVLCLEVLEHLPPLAADQLALNLSRLSGRLILSAAHEGQGGTLHINERPQDYWIGKFSDFGRHLNMTDTLEVRQEFEAACIKEHGAVACRWYLENLLVFDAVPR